MKNKILFVVGPTATGKTDLGIKLAGKFNGEILSADSRQVYKYMDIGTGKETNYFQWGIDLCEPDYDFNVSEYRKYATNVIKDIQKRKKLPIIVGGTGFYVKAILKPWGTINVPPNKKLRERLLNCSIAELQKELRDKDLGKWNLMNESDRMNPRRLVRAIEISNQKFQISNFKFQIEPLIIGLTAPYKFLYERIDKRVEERIKNGIEEERKKLAKFKLPKTLGYGDETSQEWKFAEHAYARRQMSYFRNLGKEFKINWFDITTPDYFNKIESFVKNWYN